MRIAVVGLAALAVTAAGERSSAKAAVPSPDAAALAAADAYIQSGRRGRARVHIDGAVAGTPVRARLTRHAFHFGINVTGTFNRFLIEGAPPESDAGRFQRFVLDHFNTVVPSNAGKWIYNEGVREFVTMDYIDLILRWAAQHRMFARMHTLIWDTEQQPAWAIDLLAAAAAGDAAAKADLLRAIDRRIDYYVRDRAGGYQDLDVLNESLHHPRYVDVLGAAGLAEVFNRVARVARDGGRAAAPVPERVQRAAVVARSAQGQGGAARSRRQLVPPPRRERARRGRRGERDRRAVLRGRGPAASRRRTARRVSARRSATWPRPGCPSS